MLQSFITQYINLQQGIQPNSYLIDYGFWHMIFSTLDINPKFFGTWIKQQNFM